MKVKEESEKVGLKLSIQKTKIIASSPITSWQIDGELLLQRHNDLSQIFLYCVNNMRIDESFRISIWFM